MVRRRLQPFRRSVAQPLWLPAPSSLRRFIASSLALYLLAGCAVEKWPLFAVDWDQELRDRPLPPPRIPGELQPTFTLPTTAPATQPGPMQLTVEQAAMAALSNNRDLAVQQLTPVIARAFEQIERGLWDPELFAEASVGRERASETSRATGEQFDVEGQDSTVLGGVRQRLPTGTDVEVAASGDRSFSNRTEDQHQSRLGLTVTQALLQGFGPAVNLASVRQAELETLASQYELRGFTQALLAEVETTYWLYALAQQEIVIFERSLAVAQEQRDATRQRIEVGVLPEIELAAAEAEVALRQQALIDARSELESQRFRLLRLTNPQDYSALDRPIDSISPIETDPEAIDDISERVALAMRLRPDLNEARLRVEQNRLETIVTRNGLLPRLDLFITLGHSGYANSFAGSLEDFVEGSSYDLTAGARFSYLLGNRSAEGRHAAALATAQQAQAAVQNLAQLVWLDVRLAATQVDRARQQIAATSATRALREEALRAEQERFNVGSSTNLLVAQAQRDLLESQIAEVTAIVGYRVALIALYRAEGSLLERRGIRVGW